VQLFLVINISGFVLIRACWLNIETFTYKGFSLLEAFKKYQVFGFSSSPMLVFWVLLWQRATRDKCI
jgi:hypothetical protein